MSSALPRRSSSVTSRGSCLTLSLLRHTCPWCVIFLIPYPFISLPLSCTASLLPYRRFSMSCFPSPALISISNLHLPNSRFSSSSSCLSLSDSPCFPALILVRRVCICSVPFFFFSAAWIALFGYSLVAGWQLFILPCPFFLLQQRTSLPTPASSTLYTRLSNSTLEF